MKFIRYALYITIYIAALSALLSFNYAAYIWYTFADFREAAIYMLAAIFFTMFAGLLKE